MELEFCQHIFEKSLSIKGHENPSSGNRIVSCAQIWQSYFISFSQCCERAYDL